jgi:hypothetical protein
MLCFMCGDFALTKPQIVQSASDLREMPALAPRDEVAVVRMDKHGEGGACCSGD